MHPTLEQLYFKQIPTDLKGEKDNTTSGNTHFQQWTDLDRKVNKEMLDLNHTLKQMDLTSHSIPQQQNMHSLQVHTEHSP